MQYRVETEENPKMFQVYLKQAWHEVFCYALAFEDAQRGEDKLLFTIVSGSDSALQSLRGAIDIGSSGGLKFGYGVRELTGYRFHSEKPLSAEKGKYEKFPMTLNKNRKALAIVHEDVLNNSKYVLSFDRNPARDIAQLLGGSAYGLHILPEWEDVILDELIKQQFLNKHELYKDDALFPDGLSLYSIDLTEEQADLFIERLLQTNVIRFPVEGTGESLHDVTDLTSYLLNYNEAMVTKLAEKVTPTHNPILHETLPHFSTYPRELFPVQAHAATAVAKRLRQQKAVIIQGEMSTGKSSIMTAVADGYHALKQQAGYHVCLMCPPNLTKKWPDEIKVLLPHAKVHVITRTQELIRYHAEWVRNGKPKPSVPTFFIISFTVMRGDCRTVPAVTFQEKLTVLQKEHDREPYRSGYYCSTCGKPHQMIEETVLELDEDGQEIEENVTHNMTDVEFGTSRRLKSGVKPANANCYHCGTSLWTKTVPTRFSSFKHWTKHEKRLLSAIKQKNSRLISQVQSDLPDRPTAVGMPYRLATIEYIRRKMKNFFDIAIVDEVHELKGGMTAQGNSLGSLVQASKKVVAGTGTLFGGKSEDIYYLLWRLFPADMDSSGYRYEEVGRFNDEFGNVEDTVRETKGDGEYTNTNSRGGERRSSRKVLPGISPFIYGRYMIQNIINVRLKDVWPDPVDLIDTPTIFVPMSEELESCYRGMVSAFEHEIDARKDGYKLFLPMTDYGIAYPDNPFTFPDATFKTAQGTRELIWNARHLPVDTTLPKEKKLQEIIEGEMSEGRKAIVYVRDTGSSVAERDIRPRLQTKLEEIGAKVCILDTSTTSTNARSEWLEQKMNGEGYDVCIVSQELVKVGLDLLCTPTLIYYQFSWSLFTINQSSRRAWRIGQSQECRLFYLAYEDTFQEKMAELIAQKNRATAAINGEVSSDGLSAMLGDSGDLQSMLIESIKSGESVVKGSAEDWISQTSDRARELLANIGKKKAKPTLLMQFDSWMNSEITSDVTRQKMNDQKAQLLNNIADGLIPGFSVQSDVLVIDLHEAFGFDKEFIPDGAILNHLCKPQQALQTPAEPSSEPSTVIELKTVKTATETTRKTKKISDDQLVFDLFG